MKATTFLLIGLGVLLAASSCKTSKFDFAAAYKFSYYDYQMKSKDPVNSHKAEASISEIKSIPVLTGSDYDHPTPELTEVKSNPLVVDVIKTGSDKRSYNDLSVKEKREFKNELKAELKRIRKEERQALDQKEDKPAKGLAIAALSLGIVGIFSFLAPAFLIASVAAVVTGAMAISRANRNSTSEGKKMARVGLILGVATLLIGLALVIAVAIAYN